MKYIKFFLLLLVLLIPSFVYGDIKSTNNVFIIESVKHKALDATVNGIIDTLKVANIHSNIYCGQGSIPTIQQILSNILKDNNKNFFIVGVGTLPSQIILQRIKKDKDNNITLIFSSVTDPEGAGLTQCNSSKTKESVFGVSNFVPIEIQIDTLKKLLPNIKKIGGIYNQSEQNSVFILKKLQKICQKKNIELVNIAVQNSSNIPQAVEQLISQKVDVFFVWNDNTVIPAIKSISNIAAKSKIPVYAGDTDLVTEGAFAAVGVNQYRVGVQTAKIILKLINDISSSDCKVEYLNEIELIIDKNLADKFNIKIPEYILKDSITLDNKFILHEILIN